MEYINGLNKSVGSSTSRGAGKHAAPDDPSAPLEESENGCFLCRYRDEKSDAQNLVLWRGRRCFAVLNRFPYTGGHSMVAPLAHSAGLEDLDPATLAELMEHVRDVQAVLRKVVRAEGFNVGINIGRCAGAGLPGHLHVHIVPRWSGDTNFMAVLGDVRMIPTALADLYEKMTCAAGELRLPKTRTARAMAKRRRAKGR
jgi:ATP adenylyltransferase